MSPRPKTLGFTRLSSNGYVVARGKREGKLFHVAVAEIALGKPLPKNAQVHHVDGNKRNNWPYNLVICPDTEYHRLLHQRTDALESCGHADWLKCKFCGQYDDRANLRIYESTRAGRKAVAKNIHHASCNASYLNTRYQAKKVK